MTKPIDRTRSALRDFAMGYPETTEDFPWGECVVKVRGKVFVFLGVPGGAFSVTVKLPSSASLALGLPFAQPTGYGLGKSGWVTARFDPGERPPIPVLKQWIDESYKAVAPKALVAKLQSPGEEGQGVRRRRRRRKA